MFRSKAYLIWSPNNNITFRFSALFTNAASISAKKFQHCNAVENTYLSKREALHPLKCTFSYDENEWAFPILFPDLISVTFSHIHHQTSSLSTKTHYCTLHPQVPYLHRIAAYSERLFPKKILSLITPWPTCQVGQNWGGPRGVGQLLCRNVPTKGELHLRETIVYFPVFWYNLIHISNIQLKAMNLTQIV